MIKRIIPLLIVLSMVICGQAKSIHCEDFVIEEIVGGWEEYTPTKAISKYSAGASKIVLVARNVSLGSWSSNIHVVLIGTEGDLIESAYLVEIPELGFKIEYRKNLVVGGALGMGEVKSIRLSIALKGEVMYVKNVTARWPFENRLDTRIYYSIWRVANASKLNIVVQDTYGDLHEHVGVYWRHSVDYLGTPLTLKIAIAKNSSKESQLISNVYFNEVVPNASYDENRPIPMLDIGTMELFYASLSFLVIAIVVNVVARTIPRIVQQRKP